MFIKSGYVENLHQEKEAESKIFMILTWNTK